jgi:hypothetical protein
LTAFDDYSILYTVGYGILSRRKGGGKTMREFTITEAVTICVTAAAVGTALIMLLKRLIRKNGEKK